MKKYLLALITILGAACISSCGNGSSDSKERADSANTANIDSAKAKDTSSTSQVHMADLKPDAEFAVEAADGGMLEVALGKLAEKKGTTKTIRKLGTLMVTDHSKANKELKTLAGDKQIVIPDKMSEKSQKELDDLKAKNGKDFDKAYADLMVKDHKADIDDFNKEADKGNDPQVSAWAKSKVPVLEHHLKMSEDAQKELK